MTDIETEALAVAREVEDIFCRSFEGGICQRRAAVQVAVAKAMQRIWDRRLDRVAALSIDEVAAGRYSDDR